MLAGSPPSAMTTGIRSPRSAISRQCAAPTLCRCQCIASVFAPQHLDPVHPDVADAARRIGRDHHRQGDVAPAVPRPGGEERDLRRDRPRRRAGRPPGRAARPPFTRGGNLPISASLGSIASLPNSPSGTLRLSISEMRSPMLVEVVDAERQAHPAHRAEEVDGDRLRAPPAVLEQDVLEQERGPAARALHARGRRSRRSRGARAPDGVIRTSSPMRSMALMNSRRLSRAMGSMQGGIGEPSHRGGNGRLGSRSARAARRAVLTAPRLRPHVQRAHPAHEQLEGHLREIPAPPAGARARPARETRGSTLVARYRRSYVSRSRGRSTAARAGSRTDTAAASSGCARQRHLQDHQAGAGLEHAGGLGQSGIEIHQVADSPADHRAIEGGVRETAARAHRRSPAPAGGAFARPSRSIGADEVGADDAAREIRAAGRAWRRSRACRRRGRDRFRPASAPTPAADRVAPPALIEAKADDAVEAVVGGGDGGEDRRGHRPASPGRPRRVTHDPRLT